MTQKRLSRIIGYVMVLGVALATASCTNNPGGSASPSDSPTASDTSVIEPTDSTSATPTDSATDLPTQPDITNPPASNSMDGISATGGVGDSPTLTVPWPWAIDQTRTSIIVQGDGPTVSDTGYVLVNYYGEDARTGNVFDESYSQGAPVAFPLTGVVPGFQKGLAGQKVGTRLIIAMPGPDGYDAQGGNSDAGINVGDTLVFVVDILRTQYSDPTGDPVTVTDTTLPTVSGDTDAPVITIPTGQTPPTSLVVQPLITGPDPSVVVESGDSILVNYTEYVWSTGKMVRQTYGFSPLTGALSATIPGWQQALLNQPMGSRLLLVVPPSLAYPQGFSDQGIPAGSTMVYVVDILFTSSSTI